MTHAKIEKLTPEQEALIPIYREKWQAIALSSEPIDRQKAEATLKAAYVAIGKKAPEIQFFSSPSSAILEIVARSPRQFAQQLGAPMLATRPLFLEFFGEMNKKFEIELWQKLQELLASRQSAQLTQIIAVVVQHLGRQLSEQQQQVLWQLLEQLREQLLVQMWEQQQQLMRSQLRQQPGGDILIKIGDFFWEQAVEPVWKTQVEPLLEQLANQPAIQQWEREFKQPLLQMIDGLGLANSLVQFNSETAQVAIIDFCISVLNCPYDAQKWLLLQSLASQCGWVWPFENICLVCDRPNQLSFDNENRLHAEGEPALQYADGYALYAYRGVILPEKYGKLHPNQWQARWLLEEPNAELRRAFIQGIGYSRICQELEATELDFWREYSLLRIDSDVDIEPIHLLKMTCPSTSYIHAHRVPPEVTSAREAIRWINWGTDPEEFAVET